MINNAAKNLLLDMLIASGTINNTRDSSKYDINDTLLDSKNLDDSTFMSKYIKKVCDFIKHDRTVNYLSLYTFCGKLSDITSRAKAGDSNSLDGKGHTCNVNVKLVDFIDAIVDFCKKANFIWHDSLLSETERAEIDRTTSTTKAEVAYLYNKLKEQNCLESSYASSIKADVDDSSAKEVPEPKSSIEPDTTVAGATSYAKMYKGAGSLVDNVVGLDGEESVLKHTSMYTIIGKRDGTKYKTTKVKAFVHPLRVPELRIYPTLSDGGLPVLQVGSGRGLGDLTCYWSDYTSAVEIANTLRSSKVMKDKGYSDFSIAREKPTAKGYYKMYIDIGTGSSASSVYIKAEALNESVKTGVTELEEEKYEQTSYINDAELFEEIYSLYDK